MTTVMELIEVNPEPFVLEPEIIACDGKLCEAVSPGPFQGPPLEHLIGREELLAFMFNNQFPPIVSDTAVVPIPGGLLLLATALIALWRYS